ncbi:MAG: SUMF1/EgtB/PvdO family nonheme iron enzyme [bacterium]|nr:SUMF1/EgtB/PvdO family nonheme iron enzyme [bacterium]
MTFSSCHNEEAFGDLPPKSDIECVTDDTAHLRNTGAEGFLTGGDTNIDMVTNDLNLPQTGPSGSTITWEAVYLGSGDDASAVIGPDGTVTRPSYSTGNQEIRVTATVTKGAESDTVVFYYTVLAYPNDAKAITAFSFPACGVTANISGTTISATVPYDTNPNGLVASFSASGETVHVGSTLQVSGTTANNFTSSVTYRVTAGDGSTQDYTVTVTVAQNNAKAITAYSFPSLGVTANISGTTITATVPYGTTISNLAAAFITTGDTVHVGSTLQNSGITGNNFNSPVTYRVTADDGSWEDYTVAVTVAPNNANEITAFSFPAQGTNANISGTNISASVPYGTNVTALVAAFSTTGDSVRVGSTIQYSGSTANNFTGAVTYRVTAGSGAVRDYTVTVTIAEAVEFSADPYDSDLILIKGGTYTMGDGTNACGSNAFVTHPVTITRDLYVSKYETSYSKWYTVKQAAAALGYTFDESGNIGVKGGREGRNGVDGAAPSPGNEPVIKITWEEIITWCNAYSEMKGLRPVYYANASQTLVYKNANNAYDNAYTDWTANGYRLSTEAEWEYLAREKGERYGHHYSGADYDVDQSSWPQASSVAWFDNNAGIDSHIIGSKTANGIGLFDMSGNVWEYVYDWYGVTYTNSPPYTGNDPSGPAEADTSSVYYPYRVFRGGGYSSSGTQLRASFRKCTPWDLWSDGIGFRLVRTLD